MHSVANLDCRRGERMQEHRKEAKRGDNAEGAEMNIKQQTEVRKQEREAFPSEAKEKSV